MNALITAQKMHTSQRCSFIKGSFIKGSFTKGSFTKGSLIKSSFNKTSFNTGSFNKKHVEALFASLFIAVFAGSPCWADKVEADQNNALFVPENLNYYNPLKHNKGNAKEKHYSTGSVGLSNAQLEQAAEDIRSSEMSTQHRALNHQWLQQEHEGDEPTMGGKVLSELVKMGFRTYWDGVRNKHYSDAKMVPDSSGDGKVSEDVEYKLRLSDDTVKVTFEYEF